MLAAPRSSARASSLDQHLESAQDHPFAVERQSLRIHDARHPRVLHDLGVDAVAMRPRLVQDVGKDHGLAALELDAARERRPFSHFDIVGDAFAKCERAVIAPDLAELPRNAAVHLEIPGRNRNDESIDIAHRTSPSRACNVLTPVWLRDNRIAYPEQGQSELVRRTNGRCPRRGLLPPRSGTTVASRYRRPRTRTGERRDLSGTSMGILKRSSSAICAALVTLVAA